MFSTSEVRRTWIIQRNLGSIEAFGDTAAFVGLTASAPNRNILEPNPGQVEIASSRSPLPHPLSTAEGEKQQQQEYYTASLGIFGEGKGVFVSLSLSRFLSLGCSGGRVSGERSCKRLQVATGAIPRHRSTQKRQLSAPLVCA